MFLKTRRIWKCSKCRKQFSIKAGTVFEDSPIGLDKWLPAVWLIANNRNGISSHELGRALGVTQKTAWLMLHRIRLAMQDDLTGGSLGGEIEVDETFLGGKARNMHAEKKREMQKKGRNDDDQTIVMGILERATEGKPSKVRTSILNDRRRRPWPLKLRAMLNPDLSSIPTGGVASDQRNRREVPAQHHQPPRSVCGWQRPYQMALRTSGAC